jgi:transcriptional/translational regulatory protein YebC/TACO1
LAGELEDIKRFLSPFLRHITYKSRTKGVCPHFSPFDQNLITLGEKDALQTLKLLDRLEEIDGVQHVFTNADFPDEVVQSYRSG